MKKIITIPILLLLFTSFDLFSQVKISELTLTTTPEDSSMWVMVWDSSGTKVSRRILWVDLKQVIADSLQGDGLKSLNSLINVDVSDFAGTGLEDDGSENVRIASTAAGDGLSGGSGSALAVSVDNSTIETNSDQIRVKNSGITSSHLANNAVQTTDVLDSNITAPKLSTTVHAMMGAYGSGTYPVDDKTLEFNISGVDTTAKIADVYLDTIQWSYKRVNNREFPVEWFGAVGDGATNDSSAINDGLDSLGTIGGGKLIFQSGKTYKTGRINVTQDNIEIYAVGAIIKDAGNDNTELLFINGAADDYVLNFKCTGGEWDANYANNSGAIYGAFIEYADHFNFTDVHVDSADVAFEVSHGAINGIFENCIASHYDFDGFSGGGDGQVAVDDDPDPERMTYINCLATDDDTGDNSFEFEDGCRDFTFIGCVVDTNVSCGGFLVHNHESADTNVTENFSFIGCSSNGTNTDIEVKNVTAGSADDIVRNVYFYNHKFNGDPNIAYSDSVWNVQIFYEDGYRIINDGTTSLSIEADGATTDKLILTDDDATALTLGVGGNIISWDGSASSVFRVRSGGNTQIYFDNNNTNGIRIANDMFSVGTAQNPQTIFGYDNNPRLGVTDSDLNLDVSSEDESADTSFAGFNAAVNPPRIYVEDDIGLDYEVVQVMRQWVTKAAAYDTVELGTLPDNGMVLDIDVYVQNAFNSDGTDEISIGYDSDTDAYMTLLDVSSTGTKVDTAGTSMGLLDGSGPRTVKAYYVPGGSTPSVGEAIIVLRFTRGLWYP